MVMQICACASEKESPVFLSQGGQKWDMGGGGGGGGGGAKTTHH